MGKKLLFSVFSLFLVLSDISAKASTYVTYPDFVLMDRQKKIEVIEMVQRHVVEAEYQGNLLLVKHSRKYTWLDYFTNSFTAHANPPLGNTRCMYGGWPSVAYEDTNGRLFCSNPRTLRASSPGSSQRLAWASEGFREDLDVSRRVYEDAYRQVQNDSEYMMITFSTQGGLSIQVHPSPSERPCDIENKGDIICNPAIFGKPGGKPLCVPGDQSQRGYNSSYLCQQAVANIKENQPEVYDSMMDELIGQVASGDAGENPRRTVFLNTMRSMYSMCMCANDSNYTSHQSHLNQEYAQAMFNTRTCVGIVNQTKELLDQIQSSSSCRQVLEHGDPEWMEFARKASHNLGREMTNWRELASLRRDIPEDVDPFTFEETSIREIRQPAISARQQDHNYYCHVNLEEPPVVDPPPTVDPPVEDPPVEEACSISLSRNEENENLIFITLTPAPDIGLDAYTLAPEGVEAAEEGQSHQFSYTLEEGSAISSIEAFRDGSEEAECSAPIESEQEEEPTCSLTGITRDTSGDEIVIRGSFTFNPEVEGEIVGAEDVTVEESNFTIPNQEDDTVTLALRVGETSYECSGEIEEDSAARTPTTSGENKCSMSLSLNSNGDDSEIVARVTNDGEEIAPGTEGYTVAFSNSSQGSTQDSADSSGDMLVSAAGEQEDQAEPQVGDSSFKASVVGTPSSDQVIQGVLSGPGSCSATKTYTIRAPRQPRQINPSNPGLQQPPPLNLPPRGGFLQRRVK